MSHLFREAHDNAQDILAAVAAAAYFLGFLGAVHVALARLFYY
jgi:predicted trehalose synthase